MISYRQSDIRDQIGKMPAVFMFNDDRAKKKFYDSIRGRLMSADGSPVRMPPAPTVFERNGYAILFDMIQFMEEIEASEVYRDSKLVGKIEGVSNMGFLIVSNVDPSPGESETYLIDPLEYRIGMSPDHNKVGIKYEPVS